jgi:starch synthase
MVKLTVFCGGSVGADPYSPKTWSGSCLSLLNAMDGAGILDQAVGIRVAPPLNSLLLARNFSRNRAVWRAHYYFDPAFRRALTRAAKTVPVSGSHLLQIGHMFSLPAAFPGKKCISYHDGNLSELINSGFGLNGISRQRIDQALRYEEETAAQMSAILTFSEYLRQSFISNYRIPAERVHNVGGGINLTDLPPANPGKDYSLPRILFVGTDFVRKGGPQLLEAFRIVRQALPNAELHIAGPENLKDLSPGVISHGRLSKADPTQKSKLESLFRDCSLFVIPSLYEPFGIAPLEAMLYQVPCLVTDAWALREEVRPGLNGELVTKGSVSDLSTKILAMLSNPARLADMGRRGRELILREYTWSAVAQRMTTAAENL